MNHDHDAVTVGQFTRQAAPVAATAGRQAARTDGKIVGVRGLRTDRVNRFREATWGEAVARVAARCREAVVGCEPRHAMWFDTWPGRR